MVNGVVIGFSVLHVLFIVWATIVPREDQADFESVLPHLDVSAASSPAGVARRGAPRPRVDRQRVTQTTSRPA